MARIVVIGGIESTFKNLQTLHELGEEVLMFFTRGKNSPGWEGVDLVDETQFPAARLIPRTIVETHINDYVDFIQKMKPDFIYSLGWQQIFSKALLSICPVIGIHESLLPEGAGAVPIANAVLHDFSRTGVSLFWVDSGMDTGPLIGQLQGKLDPRKATSTALYNEAMELETDLLKMFVPQINKGTAPRIPQDFSKRTTFSKVNWNSFDSEKVKRAKTYPYA